ncbi:hypothetical protein QOZ88_19400 [Blastococcus sp. BMG 814]|uniref:Uncharacterized protein n=1 Tax=Blastococcus carthaginiensis TaxID=3050034 RepID=A0ABT9IGT6_9ACTN|nr:hypothetical protein [Blastococcus carthaginiensis]MDP5184805.1 hypothetical protein [Blastococcus carthaginiensis]
MFAGRSVSVGLLAVLCCLAACASDAAPPPAAVAPGALPGYTPPAGAPDLCAGVAGSRHFLDIPVAMGRLASGVAVVDGRSHLAAARGELRGLVADMPVDEDPELRAAADRVLTALLAVLDPPLTEEARTAVLASMDDFVARLQSTCRFPA